MRHLYVSFLLFIFPILASGQGDQCLVASTLTVSPTPNPITHTYDPGSSVEFCYTVFEWQLGPAAEWLHAVEILFGQGWDQGSINPVPPPSCDGTGYWDWYPSWQSSATGQIFGSGFAYDSYNGGPYDGDPGNNHGDGQGGCAQIGINSPPKTFCWTIDVREDYQTDNINDLGLTINALSDGESGSWAQSVCNSWEIDYFFNPEEYFYENIIDYYRSSSSVCDSACTGEIVITTLEEEWHHRLSLNSGEIIFEDSLPTGIDTISGLCPGFYTLESTSLISNFTFSDQFTIFNRVRPIAVASTNSIYCEGDFPPLFGSAQQTNGSSVSYQWQGPNGYASNAKNPTDAPGPGLYTLTTRVGNCQSDPDTIVVPAPLPRPEISITSGNQVFLCAGGNTELTAEGADTYEWYTEQGILFATGPTATVMPVATRTYQVRGLVDGDPCEGIAEVTVYIDDFSAIDIGPEQNVCVSGPTTFGPGVSGLDYLWSTGETTSTITIDLATPTSYALTVTAPGGCSDEFETLLIPVANPTAEIEALSTLLCKGDSTLLIAQPDVGTPPYTFAWSTGESSDTITVIPEVTTTYTLTVTDSNGCTDEASVMIEVISDQTTIVAANPVVCEGETTTLTVNEFANFYDWSTGQVSQMIEIAPSTSSVYEVTIMDFNGCLKTDTILIEVVPPPNPPIINCTSTTSSIVFSWEVIGGFIHTASSISGPDGLQTDSTYTVSGLSPNDEVTIELAAFSPEGCVAINQQTCSAIDCPNVELEITEVIDVCEDAAPFLLEVIATGGSGGGTIIWQGACITDPSTGQFDAQLCGPGTYQVIATYSEGPCVYQAATEVTILPIYQAEFTLAQEACITDTVTVQYTGDAPNDAVFNWNFGAATVLSGSGPGPYELRWANAGDYIVELSLGGDCPSETISHDISITTPLDAPEVSCDLDVPNGIISFGWNTVVGATSYQLSLNGEDLPNITETEISFDSFAPGENAILLVTPIGDGLCTNASGQAGCALPICPELEVSPTQNTLCEGEAVPLSASYGSDATYTWSPPTGLSCTDCPNPVATPGTSTTYTVTASNASGCEESAEISIIVNPLPSVFLEDAYDVCLGETVELCLQNVQMVVWTGPNGYYYENPCLIIPDFAEENSGTYYMEVTFLDGCTLNDSLDILAIPPLEVIQVPEQVEACPNQIFTLSAEVNNADFYYWFPIKNVFCPNCPTTLASITHPTVFTLIVLDETGCEMRFEIPAVIPPGCQQQPDIDDPIFLTGTGNEGPVDMVLFPNPSHDQVMVQWNQEVEGNLQLFDTQGKLVQQTSVRDQTTTLDLQVLPSGIYWVRWTSERGTISKKLLKE